MQGSCACCNTSATASCRGQSLKRVIGRQAGRDGRNNDDGNKKSIGVVVVVVVVVAVAIVIIILAVIVMGIIVRVRVAVAVTTAIIATKRCRPRYGHVLAELCLCSRRMVRAGLRCVAGSDRSLRA